MTTEQEIHGAVLRLAAAIDQLRQRIEALEVKWHGYQQEVQGS